VNTEFAALVYYDVACSTRDSCRPQELWVYCHGLRLPLVCSVWFPGRVVGERRIDHRGGRHRLAPAAASSVGWWVNVVLFQAASVADSWWCPGTALSHLLPRRVARHT
jgi:hypothetical protein